MTWAARLAAIAAGPATRRALAAAARAVAPRLPALAGVWALGGAGDVRVGLVRLPGSGSAAELRDAALDWLGRGARGAKFVAGRYAVRVLRERGSRRVLGGVALHPGRAVARAELGQLEDLLRLWFARDAARGEARAQESGLALSRALADGLLTDGDSPLGLDQLFAKLRSIIPLDTISLAFPGGQRVHVLPVGVDAGVTAQMEAELRAAGAGEGDGVIERVGTGSGTKGRRKPGSQETEARRGLEDDRELEGRRKRVRASVVLPVPDPGGGEPALLGIFSFRDGALTAEHVAAVAQLMPGLAQALASARAVRAMSAASRESSLELGRARELQLGIAPEPLAIPGLDVKVGSRAVAGVSGDFHQILALGDDRLAVLVADVTGHGVAAAIEAAFLQGVLATEGAPRGPAARLARLNASLDGRAALMTSALAIEVDARRLVYCAAGHPPPLVIRRGRALEASLEGDLLLGVQAEWRGQATSLALQPGDLVVLYTDGVVEAEGRGGRFGRERLAAVCAGAGSAAEAVSAIEGALADFDAGDDRTVIAIRMT